MLTDRQIRSIGKAILLYKPLTERRGRQICERHWRRHQDPKDGFDLFDVFKFRRPTGLYKPVAKKDTPRCSCGRELLPGRRFCAACAAERERLRKKQAYHDRKNQQQQPIEQENILLCRQCGGQRNPGHTYCLKCAERRKTVARRQAQSRYWRKRHTVGV